MYTLGINAVFHDSAACIVKDGHLLAAAEEERFTRIKHGKRPVPFSTYELPFNAVDFCLQTAGIHLSEVDHVAYSFDPSFLLEGEDVPALVTLPLQAPPVHDEQPGSVYPGWDSLFLSYLTNAPNQLVDGWPHHLQKRFAGSKTSDFQWHYVEHHLAHAVSAFFPSPYHNAAVLTLDGRGELASTAYYAGRGTSMEKLRTVNMPHSLGMLYEAVTTHLGFLHSSDEYKVMALASFGKPAFVEEFRSIVAADDYGGYTIKDLNLEQRFGKARRRDEPLTQQHYDIAHSLQLVLQETVLKLVGWLHTQTQMENLCMAGGVSLNCVMNAVVRDSGPFKHVWIQPAAGDAGTALGAALWVDANEPEANDRVLKMDHAYWGPGYDDEEIERFLRWSKVPYRRLDNITTDTAQMLAEDKIVAWFQGRMEFGPRSLGSRSILASPISPAMQQRLNNIKDREDFRPVAPVVLEDDAPEWFEDAQPSPFMLFVNKVRQDKASRIPAVRHVDGTARIQTVNKLQHSEYYELLVEFKKITGVPVLVNTSFNTRGEPIVCTPRDAIECFWTSPVDALVIGPFVLAKDGARSEIDFGQEQSMANPV